MTKVLYTIIRWIARLSGVFLIAFNIIFIGGELIYGGKGEENLVLSHPFLFVTWIISSIGMGMGWKRELSGGAVAIAGYIGSIVVGGLFPKPGWFNPFIAAFAFVGILFIIAGWLRTKEKSKTGDAPVSSTE